MLVLQGLGDVVVPRLEVSIVVLPRCLCKICKNMNIHRYMHDICSWMFLVSTITLSMCVCFQYRRTYV